MRTIALAALTCFLTGYSAMAPAQTDMTRAQKCSPVKIEWNKANKAGIPGRRKAMKAIVDSAKADPVTGECLSDKIRDDLLLAAADSSVMQGWAVLLKINSFNFDAAKEQAVADRCPASMLVIAGWNAFYAKRGDVSAGVNDTAQRRHKELCGA